MPTELVIAADPNDRTTITFYRDGQPVTPTELGITVYNVAPDTSSDDPEQRPCQDCGAEPGEPCNPHALCSTQKPPATVHIPADLAAEFARIYGDGILANDVCHRMTGAESRVIADLLTALGHPKDAHYWEQDDEDDEDDYRVNQTPSA